MKIYTSRFILFVLLIVLSSLYSSAQSLVVGSNQEDFYRRAQLLGITDSTISFMIRPLINGTWEVGENINSKTSARSKNDAEIRILPFSWQNQYTSHHAYGWNNGSMIPSKGYQGQISGGIHIKNNFFSLQLKPELVFAENATFEEFPEDHYPIIWKWYYDNYNHIDLPVRFGNSQYAKLNLGQSSLRFNHKNISVGLSTENLWWGPGIRNSLLMSNSAPGFLHLTLNTQKPIQTKIGSFEGQFIIGKLENSDFTPPDSAYLYRGTTIYAPKPNDNRSISGIVLTYQPKWINGLFLGYSRTSQNYSKNLSKLKDYFPFFSSFNSYKATQKTNTADQYTSLFFRWLFSEEHMEVYMEYGSNNQSKSFSEVLKDPNYGRAYIFGLRKLFPIRDGSSQLMTSFEITNLSQSSTDIVNNVEGWYVDRNVRQGYTNRGQMLGAGIGPGGNLQSVDVSWVKGPKSIGLQLERYAHNLDFYYYAYIPSGDWRRSWIDLSVAAHGNWDFKQFIFNASLNYIHSFNYGWYLLQTDPNVYLQRGRDADNVQFQLGVAYKF